MKALTTTKTIVPTMKPTINKIVPEEVQKELFIAHNFTCPICKKTVPDICLLAVPLNYTEPDSEYTDTTRLSCICSDCMRDYESKCQSALPYVYQEEKIQQFGWFMEFDRKQKEFENQQNQAIAENIERHLGGDYSLSNKARFELDKTRQHSNAIRMIQNTDKAARSTIKYDHNDHITEESADRLVEKIHGYAYTEKLPPLGQQVNIMSGMCEKKGYTIDEKREFKKLLNEYGNLLMRKGMTEDQVVAHLKDTVNKELWKINSWLRTKIYLNSLISKAGK